MTTAVILIIAFLLGAALALRAARLAERIIESDARLALMEAKIVEARNMVILERTRSEREMAGLQDLARQLGATNPFHTCPAKDAVTLQALARLRMSESAARN